MTEDERYGEARSRGEPSPTRRGVLALAGAAVVAGCSSLPVVGGGGSEVTVDAGELEAVTGDPLPAATEPLPVEVASSHPGASRDRVESALGNVPLPLSAEEVPNGVMRAEIREEAEYAREALSTAADAGSARERLDRLRDARESARYVAAAWRYTTGDVTPADLRERRETVREATRSFREEWAYVGTDPVRAVLVHEAVESWANRAESHAAPRDRLRPPATAATPTPTAGDERSTTASREPATSTAGEGRSPPTPVRPRSEPTNALTVGERAGETEAGRAYLDDARHVGEQFVASLSDPESMRTTLTDARESLTATVADRRSGLPGPDVDDPNELVDVDRDLEDTAAAWALRALHWDFATEYETTDDLASDVVERVREVAGVTAFASLRERVADGETFPVESAADVGDRRSAAVAAAEDALAESPDRRLARRLLAPPLGRLASVDRELAEYDDSVSADWLATEVGEYLAAAAFARTVPGACTEALDALGVE